jgi:uncharacterized protein (TIGR02246 family)
MKVKPVFVVVLLAAAALACQAAEEPSIESSEAISTGENEIIYRTMESLAQAWNSGDLEATRVFFADEFTQMPPNEVARVGLEEVNNIWVEFLDENTDVWEPTLSEVQIVGDLAFARGSASDTATPKAGGEPLHSESNALWIFRRPVDGSWKMIFEYWMPKEAIGDLAQLRPAPPTDENTAIYEVMETMAATWNAGDFETNLALFTEDFSQMPPDEPIRVGIDTMAEIWREFREGNDAVWEPTVVEVRIVGDLAFGRGRARDTVTPKAGGETVVSEYDTLWVYERQPDGSWLMSFEYYLPKTPS